MSEAGGSKTLAPVPATGLRRVLYVCAGFFFLGMAYLGAILPGLPTTPWVLLASYCFGRSSPRLNRWLKRTPYFGGILHDWDEHRGMRKSKKILSTCIIIPVVTTSVIFAPVPEWARFIIGCLGIIGVCVIWFVVPLARIPVPPLAASRKLPE